MSIIEKIHNELQNEVTKTITLDDLKASQELLNLEEHLNKVEQELKTLDENYVLNIVHKIEGNKIISSRAEVLDNNKSLFNESFTSSSQIIIFEGSDGKTQRLFDTDRAVDIYREYDVKETVINLHDHFQTFTQLLDEEIVNVVVKNEKEKKKAQTLKSLKAMKI